MTTTLEHCDRARAGGNASLTAEVRRLTDELADANLRLRRNLVEKDRMQAILLSTLQSLTQGVLAVGQDGIVIAANPAACRLLSQPLESLAGRPIDAILPETHAISELLLTLQGVGGAQRKTMWHPWPEASYLLSAIRALPPYDQQLAGLILIEDRTEMSRLETQAQLRSRLTGMGEIAMNLAHEIRNPLGSIALFASALEHELAAQTELAQLAGQISLGVRSLDHLVANTLEFAKPRRIVLSRISLNRALADALVFVQHPLAQKHIALQFDHDLFPDAWVAGDAEQLRQVFLNLYLNAIQAMEEGGTLAVSLQGAGEAWQVTIADDGIGIPEELLGRIFDPFFTTREKGSGIGLAVVHQILSAHDARIEVASQPAAGTAVHVFFKAGAQSELDPGAAGSLFLREAKP